MIQINFYKHGSPIVLAAYYLLYKGNMSESVKREWQEEKSMGKKKSFSIKVIETSKIMTISFPGGKESFLSFFSFRVFQRNYDFNFKISEKIGIAVDIYIHNNSVEVLCAQNTTNM